MRLISEGLAAPGTSQLTWQMRKPRWFEVVHRVVFDFPVDVPAEVDKAEELQVNVVDGLAVDVNVVELIRGLTWLVNTQVNTVNVAGQCWGQCG